MAPAGLDFRKKTLATRITIVWDIGLLGKRIQFIDYSFVSVKSRGYTNLSWVAQHRLLRSRASPRKYFRRCGLCARLQDPRVRSAVPVPEESQLMPSPADFVAFHRASCQVAVLGWGVVGVWLFDGATGFVHRGAFGGLGAAVGVVVEVGFVTSLLGSPKRASPLRSCSASAAFFLVH